MSYLYSLYGFTIEVPFQCPLVPLAAAGDAPDVRVVEGDVPYRFSDDAAEGENWQALPNRYLLRGGRNSGRFLVENGQTITLQRNHAAEDDMLAAHLVLFVMIAFMRQRGYLVLHANVVQTAVGSIALCGEAGAGKSTTMGALLARGGKMIADDVCPLCFSSDGRVVVLPGAPRLNLCEDAAEEFGHDVSTLRRNPLRVSKVLVPVKEVTEDKESVLSAICLLDQYDGDAINKKLLRGAEKFAVLQEAVYGPMLPAEHPGQFALFAAVAEQVAMYRIDRPACRWSLDEVVETILNG
jgi:hypothetical protein